MWLFDFKNEIWEPWLYITTRLSNYLDNLQTKWISPITLGVMNFSIKYQKHEANILELTCHIFNPTIPYHELW